MTDHLQFPEVQQAIEHLHRTIANVIENRVELETLAELKAAKEAVVTAERNKERFRYALFVYLQERDGPAGKGAPTPETLALIRDLLTDDPKETTE